MEAIGVKVLITGVTGFLGSRVLESLLKDKSNYQVRGTVRSLAGEKMKPIKEVFEKDLDRIEFVEADLLDAESLDNAVRGCDYVIHVASPFVIESPKDENVLIKPAVNGTRAVLEACLKHKVKRLIVTASTACIVDPNLEDKKEFNEDDWPEISKKIRPY
jgi:dihydroflavonol-4-reductase